MSINIPMSLSNEEGLVLFWSHKENPGQATKACLSQWYPCRFMVDGIVYSSAEQYMMAQKAIFMNDRESYIKIMAEHDPKTIKALGRQIKNFNPRLWNLHKKEVVFEGNYFKFSQNPELGTFLLSTGKKILAEASPVDKVWGIGLAADDPYAKFPHSWKGQNLLGEALMRVRTKLKSELFGTKVRCGETPHFVTDLAPDEIFVFGSNLQGMHGGGAARIAHERFGAVMGVGFGLQGHSFAIPTMHGGPREIAPYVDRFLEFARNNRHLKFLVTRIGCGIAGFCDEEIAPLFRAALGMANVSLPISFIKILTE